uniref:beta-2-microglobulin-like isoform X3 n=1 Tax=Scatophagus argus TaxID=75038 RepID=UPI001ED8565E|nr:beta-2-microglobulin-like isoform X3 [Scatophagus argus]
MTGLHFLYKLTITAVLLCTTPSEMTGLHFLYKLTITAVLLCTTPSVPPIVKIRQTKPAAYGEQSMLECSARGFFPQDVTVSWLRDGVEVTTDVSSTDVLANGDWSFQLQSYLEFTPQRGERVSCRVNHSSLHGSLEVDWDADALDAKHLKKMVGIIFFFIGFTAAAGGAVYYWWKQRFDFSPLGRQGQTSPRRLSEL